MHLIESLNIPENIAPIFGVIPFVFVFLWVLIFIDFKNFKASKKGYTEHLATDPVMCYINYDKFKMK